MLPVPTSNYVAARIAQFDGDSRYYGAERAVQLVFGQWPGNTEYEQVLVKVIVLNRLYSTNIYDPYTVAWHIVGLKIDDRLATGDPQLVADLASVAFGEGGAKPRVLYSFATKYCSWHRPEHFQIYDSYVDWLVWEYQRQFSFSAFAATSSAITPRS